MNPNSPLHIARLRRHIENSRKMMQPFLRKRKDALEEYVGRNYSDSGARKPVPLNYIEMAVNLYRRLLAPQSPRINVVTPHRQLWPAAFDLEIALNYILREVYFGDSLQNIIMEAMFGIGAVKVGVTGPEMGEVMGWRHDGGQPYVDPIDLEDWIMDMTARSWERCGYFGNKYSMPWEFVMSSPEFTNKQDLAPRKNRDDGIGDNLGVRREDRSSELSQGRGGYYTDEVELDPEVDLMDVWLPREKLLVTLPAFQPTSLPLRILPWTGPEEGPFRMLTFATVPGNVMPLPPVSQWMDLHKILNETMRKLGRQGSNLKRVLAVPRGEEATIQKFTDASDGEAISVETPEVIQEIRTGGVDGNHMAFMMQVRQLLSMIEGNIDTLGGFGTGADTLGQERLVNENAGQRVADMQEKTSKFIEGVVRDVAWYMWHDPRVQIPLTKKIEGTDIEIPFVWNQDRRQGTFDAYSINMEPYSMTHRSPSQKLSMINNMVTGVMLPMQQMMMQQGMFFDIKAYLRMVARYSDMPELNDLIQSMAGDLSPVGPVQEREGMQQPQFQQREVVRRNESNGGTQQGREQAQIMALLGAANQQQQAMMQ